MTTYSISGIAYDYRDTEDHSSDYATKFYPSVSLDVVGTVSSGFTYDVTRKDLGDGEIDVDITLSSDTYSIFLGGTNAKTMNIDAGVLGVQWTKDGAIVRSVILELDHGKGDDAEGYYHGTRYLFVLGGSDLPKLSSLAEYEAFANTGDFIIGVFEPGGDLGEGELIPWGSISNSAVVTEDDDISGTSDKDVLSGGAGDDYFLSSEGNDTYKGGVGAFDQVSYKDDPSGVVANLATGKATDGWGDTDKLISIEMLRGSPYDDTLTGNKGDNHIRGLAGDDVLNGGKGLDTVRYDRDANYGGTDGVTVNLKKGFAIDGFGDRDTLKKFENVRGTVSKDTITGTKAANDIRGEGGADVLKGLGGKDVLEGGGGNDKLYGGNGKDVLYGGNGKDKLDGGKGDDDLYGGAKTDIFIFSSNFGNDTIHDFRTKGTGEKIDLSGVTSIKNFKDLSNNHLSEIAGNTVIDDGSGNTITLDGVAVSDLAANDFLF